MDPEALTPFDFDAWRELAENDPERYETLRREAIEQLIASAPADIQQRLRGLQWQIDRTREKFSNPLLFSARLSGLMWERLAGDGGLLENLVSLAEAVAGNPPPARPKAPVLPLQPPRGSADC